MTAWSGRKVGQARAALLSMYGDTCWLCGQPGARTVDHVVPRQFGGTDMLDNLRLAHFGCNVGRGNRTRHAKRTRVLTPSTPARNSRAWL